MTPRDCYYRLRTNTIKTTIMIRTMAPPPMYMKLLYLRLVCLFQRILGQIGRPVKSGPFA
jgi:hypothetical protein